MKIPKSPKKTRRASKGVYLNNVASNIYIDQRVTDKPAAIQLAQIEALQIQLDETKKKLDKVAAKLNDATELARELLEFTDRLIAKRVKTRAFIDDSGQEDLRRVFGALHDNMKKLLACLAEVMALLYELRVSR